MGAFDAMHGFLQQPTVMKVVILVSIVLLVIVAILVIRRVLKTSLTVKPVFSDMISGSGERVVIKASNIPDLSNGSEFGYSFWLYLSPGPGAMNDRLIIAHSTDSGVRICLDRDSNSLKFMATGATDAPTIKYVPMSRWVHIVAVYANGTLTFFMDGEVHSVHAINVPPTFAGPSGNMTISGGANAVATNTAGFSGYVGYVSYLNFYPSTGLVKRLYAQGPTPSRGFFSMFGMHGYGVRTPIYRLNTVRPGGEKTDKL